MPKHPKNVKGFKGSLDQLAKAIGNMTYDQVAIFLEKFAEDIERQADADLSLRGRRKLASRLYAAAAKLHEAKKEMGLAWKICEPHMKD